MNILIVDDVPNIARVTAMAFEVLGCRPFTAPTAAAARQVLGAEKIDAVFLDVNLSGECGLEFLSQLLAQPEAPPVVMFTAMTKEEVGGEAIRRGAFDCLVKPFTLDDLRRHLARIEQHLLQRKTPLNCP